MFPMSQHAQHRPLATVHLRGFTRMLFVEMSKTWSKINSKRWFLLFPSVLITQMYVGVFVIDSCSSPRPWHCVSTHQDITALITTGGGDKLSIYASRFQFKLIDLKTKRCLDVHPVTLNSVQAKISYKSTFVKKTPFVPLSFQIQ